MRPVSQYAYVVDPYPARITRPSLLRGYDVSGLSDLLLLPDGGLLALERSFAGDSTGAANIRIRIYRVDVSGATDVSRPPFAEGLAGRDATPAAKRLLWEENFGLTNSNFEGFTLGPRLRNGDRALLLVADNNGGAAEAIYALRLSGIGK
jgi:3-phytase